MKHSSAPSNGGFRRPLLDTPLESLPGVDEASFSCAAEQLRYRHIRDAITLFYDGLPIAAVAAKAHCSARNFHRILKRFWTVAPDGRPSGYRALIPHARLGNHVRLKPIPEGYGSGSGLSGAFSFLMQRRPAIERGLIDYLSRKGKRAFQPNTTTISRLHEEFLQLCLHDGIGEGEYPFNTVSRGIKGLRYWFTGTYLPKHVFRYVKVEHGASAATSFGQTDQTTPQPYTARPFRCWQLDELTIDVAARYETLTDDFVWVSRDVKRTSAIVVRDVDGGAIPAWRLVLGAAATVSDLLTVFWNAINGPVPVSPAIADLDYAPGAGYPASVIEKVRFALPNRIELDNAFAHLADAFRNMLQNVCGIEVVLGRPRTPKSRAAVESEVSVLATGLLHEAPATTGTGPRDPRRAKASVAVSKRIRTNELEHAMDVYFADKNATARRATHHMVVLDRLRRYSELDDFHPNYLPVDKRHAHFFGQRRLATVKVDIKGGRAPYINFFDRRYCGPALRQFVAHAGRKLVVRSNDTDLRTVHLFELNGAEIGMVRAEGAWGFLPHDERIRRLYAQLKREGRLGPHPDRDPLRKLFAHLNSGAPRDAKIALQLVHLMEYLRPRVDQLEALGELSAQDRLMFGPAPIELAIRPIPKLTLVPTNQSVAQERYGSENASAWQSPAGPVNESPNASNPRARRSSKAVPPPDPLPARPPLKVVYDRERFLLPRKTIRR